MEILPGNIELSTNVYEKEIWKILRECLSEDAGILGYKIPALGAKENIEIPSFIIRSSTYGIIIIDVLADKITSFEDDNQYWIKEDGDEIYSRDIVLSNFGKDIKNKLSKSLNLYSNKSNQFTFGIDPMNPVRSIIIFPNNRKDDFDNLDSFNNHFLYKDYNESLCQFIDSCKMNPPLTDSEIDEIDSILEGTSVFNRKRTRIHTKIITRNDLIKKSLIQTFKLDSVQRSVAMQVPNGPQRIRGLAGTGKTVILSMKAALTHISNKDFKILFVFNTQSMYNQIINNVEKYTIEESSSAPNWNNLKILHAWGGRKKEGLYSYLCSLYGDIPKTLYEVKNIQDPYQYIYEDFLKKHRGNIEPIYDMVLIDEAQDFPPAFFETIFHITKDPKRIIWAYDEFQSLNELLISDPENIFGKNSLGKPNISNSCIDGTFEDGISKDYMLPNSYRNSRKVLMYAHGLGLGLYSDNAKVPMKDKFSWEARGYKILNPIDKDSFTEEERVIVERPDKYSKNILENLIKETPEYSTDNIITYRNFDTHKEELDYVIKGIIKLIRDEKIEPEEIMVISLDKSNAAASFNYIRSCLNQENVLSIMPGFVESADSFKEEGRITLTTAFRAKGNESNIVFVINSQKIIGDSTLRDRNAIFVSITRSRGWCYVTGNGINGTKLKEEIDKIEASYPKFNFIFPSDSDYTRRLSIIRESDKSLIKKEKSIDDLLKEDVSLALLIEKAKNNPETYEKLKKMMGL